MQKVKKKLQILSQLGLKLHIKGIKKQLFKHETTINTDVHQNQRESDMRNPYDNLKTIIV